MKRGSHVAMLVRSGSFSGSVGPEEWLRSRMQQPECQSAESAHHFTSDDILYLLDWSGHSVDFPAHIAEFS